MIADAPNNWPAANQRYLMARLAVVRAALQAHIAKVAGNEVFSLETHEQAMLQVAAEMSAPSALATLCSAFALSPFERDVLLLCAGIELDATFAAELAAAQGNPQRTYPTFSLALAALPDAHWSALAPVAPLRRWRLLEIGAGDVLVHSPLRIDERVLHYLTGVSYTDPRLQGLLISQPAPPELPPSQLALADRIADVWEDAPLDRSPIIHLSGEASVGKRGVAAYACDLLGLRLHVMRAADVPVSYAEREALARLWERESLLGNSALLIDDSEHENQRAVQSLLEQTQARLLVAAREPLPLSRGRFISVEINKPGLSEQRDLWQRALGESATQLNGALDSLVGQFNLGMNEIDFAVSRVLTDVTTDTEAEIGRKLWDACRTQARTRLDDLAQRIEPAAGWDDLVLPAGQYQILHDIAAQVRRRTKVYDTWGFATKGARGLGISALFAGVSGTGKTMAAEVLANELRLDLYRIDLSAVVSKYIGETEKNLRRVFDAAEAGGAVLLFDEADALFGKRSEVKDSHDRYANIEVSYLLQRMEAYRGLAILTTNMKNALDTAFLRRLRFVVQFPFPDAAQRAEIWRRIFPTATPAEALDWQKLARLNVTGGNIRNIALQSAFLAAELNEPVRMRHLLRAARSEYAKLEKQLTESEIRDWV